MHKYKKEDFLLKKWKLIQQIGEGGNSVVFEVENTESQTEENLAVKIINIKNLESSHKKYQRFSDEIEIQNKFTQSNNSGVLPLIGFNLPENPSKENPILLFMPIAKNSVEFFKNTNDNFEDIVRCIHDISVALKSLTIEDGEFLHRDIKPTNIFRYKDKWCLGDFGLSDFEDKKDITKKDEKMGSIYFMSPEIIENNNNFSEKSEVYALAKSLYCLLVDSKYPIPGPHDISDFYTTVSTYRTHSKVSQIDVLIENATKNNPDERINLYDFTKELDAWLKPEVMTSKIKGLGESIKLIRAKVKPRFKMIEKRDLELIEINKINQRTCERIQLLYPEIVNNDFIYIGTGNNSISNYYISNYNSVSYDIENFGHSMGNCVVCGCNTEKMLKGGFGFIHTGNNEMIIICGVFFEEIGKGYSNDWVKFKKVKINSSIQEKTIDEFIELFNIEFSKKIKEFSKWI